MSMLANACQRKARKQKEKQRRDDFNYLIQELKILVCHGSEKKMCKASVLQMTIQVLKQEESVGWGSSNNTVPSFLSTSEYSQLMLEALDGFVIAMTTEGLITYISHNVATVLGHLPSSMVNRSIFFFTHVHDHAAVKYCLELSTTRIIEKNIQFGCHFMRSFMKGANEMSYKYCQVNGSCKEVQTQSANELNKCIVVVVKPVGPMLRNDVCYIDRNNSEFVFEVSLEWKFLSVDAKVTTIFGYSPSEILGKCIYHYNHQEDLKELARCHKDLLRLGEVTTGYYRLLTKGQEWVWLKTHFRINYNRWNFQPKFIVCANTAVSYLEVVRFKELSMTIAERAGIAKKGSYLQGYSPGFWKCGTDYGDCFKGHPQRGHPSFSHTSAQMNEVEEPFLPDE